MGRFKHLWWLFTRKSTNLTKPLHHLEAKLALATSSTNSGVNMPAQDDLYLFIVNIDSEVDVSPGNDFEKWWQPVAVNWSYRVEGVSVFENGLLVFAVYETGGFSPGIGVEGFVGGN